ncbi:MAG: zinc ribbon domain-containing protein [Nitrosomonadales bacterium]|nr:zinc ribbon domain-containing protein [Nitrosomonadales bacterium]
MEQNNQKLAGLDWIGRYVAVILLSLILATVIGNMDLFAKTSIGKLSASHIVQFLGYGAALVAFWVLGQRATMALQQHSGKWSFLQHLILPTVSLVVVALAHSVLLLLLKSLMDASLHNLYNWIFIFGILACAGWLVMAVLNQSASLTALLTSRKFAGQDRLCAGCGASCGATDKFCGKCGKALGDKA